MNFVVNGMTQNFRGTISILSADNLAAWDLGGYIQLASALRQCRFCVAIREDMISKVVLVHCTCVHCNHNSYHVHFLLLLLYSFILKIFYHER